MSRDDQYRRREYVKGIGSAAVASATAGAGLATPAAAECRGGCGPKTDSNTVDTYNQLSDKSAQIEHTTAVNVSEPQSRPQGKWAFYVAINDVAFAYDEDDNPTGVIGQERTAVKYDHGDDEHFELPQSKTSDWIARCGGSSYQDAGIIDDYGPLAEFTYHTVSTAIDLGLGSVPDPVDITMDVAEYVKDVAGIAEDNPGWLPWDNEKTVEWKWNSFSTVGGTFTLFEIDNVDPGDAVSFDVENYVVPREDQYPSGNYYGPRTNVSYTVRAPSYDSPDTVDW